MASTRLRTIALLLALTGSSCLAAENHKDLKMTVPDDLRAIAPAMEGYATRFIAGGLWKDTSLTPRDRSLVTVAALFATGLSGSMPEEIGKALDNGVKPSEISEIVLHLSMYTGLANGNAAATEIRKVFAERAIGADKMAPADPKLLPLDEKAEAIRLGRVGKALGPTFQDLQDYTTNALFKDLWLRPALAPRDRSLVTITALVATGRTAQLASHINLGMDNGLTRTEIASIITHLAFYSGWPNAMSAVLVANEVFAKRQG